MVESGRLPLRPVLILVLAVAQVNQQATANSSGIGRHLAMLKLAFDDDKVLATGAVEQFHKSLPPGTHHTRSFPFPCSLNSAITGAWSDGFSPFRS